MICSTGWPLGSLADLLAAGHRDRVVVEGSGGDVPPAAMLAGIARRPLLWK